MMVSCLDGGSSGTMTAGGGIGGTGVVSQGSITAFGSIVVNGTEYTCVKIKEWNPLEPDVVEYKYFAENVGLVLEEKEDGSEAFELLETAVDTSPDIDSEDFVATIDNPYFPLTPGTTYTYEGETEDGTETIEVFVSSDTKVVMGVTCVVVEDRVYLDEELIEET
jgi:hypothetical protein